MSILLLIVIDLIVAPLDTIIYIEWINGLKNYKFLSGAIICPLIIIPFYFIPFLIYKYKGLITFKNTDLSQKNLIILGIFDGLVAILASISVPNISIFTLIISARCSLVFTMILSYYLLDRRYLLNHYISLVLTMLCILFNIIPQFINKNYSNYNEPISVCIYIICIFILVLSYTYKEKYLKGNKKDLNIFWMNTMISLWQFIFGIIIMSIFLIYYIFYEKKSIDLYITNWLNCQFLGTNYNIDDNCNKSLLWLILYEFLNTLVNVIMNLILRNGSSLIYLIISTLKTPLTVLFGYLLITYNVINNSSAQKTELNYLDYISLVVLIISSLVYNIKPEQSKYKNNEIEQSLLNPINNQNNNAPLPEFSINTTSLTK